MSTFYEYPVFTFCKAFRKDDIQRSHACCLLGDVIPICNTGIGLDGVTSLTDFAEIAWQII